MSFNRIFFFVSLFVFPITLWAHAGATGIVKERMDSFKESKASMKQIKNALRTQDYDTVARESLSIHNWAEKLSEYFPKGSNPHPSEALNVIWEEFEQFQAKADEQTKASNQLHKAALSKDEKAAKKAFSDLAQTCKACHEAFRE